MNKIIHPDTTWYSDKGYENMVLVQSNYPYGEEKEIVFNTSPHMEGAKTIAGFGSCSVAIFRITKKIFVNQNGELI